MTEHSPALNRIVHAWSTNRIVALYAAIGSAWILLSDRLVVFNAPDAATIALLSMGKGLGYVAVTAALLHWLINRYTAELREREERFRTVADFTYDWEYWIDTDGQVLYMSPACERITGYRVEDFSRDPQQLIAIVHPDDRAEFERHVHDASSRTNTLIDFRIIRRDGEIRWINHACQPVSGSGSRQRGRRVTNRDITERMHTQEDLDKYKQIVSSTQDGIAFLDNAYRYRIVNDAYELLSGTTRDQLIGQTLSDQLGTTVFEKSVMPTFSRCLQGETIRHQEWFQHPTRGRRFIEMTYSPYRDTHGQILGVVANVRDETDHKLAEDALRQSEALYRSLVTVMPDGVAAIDVNGNVTFASPHLLDMHGGTLAEVVGTSPLNWIAPEYQTKAAANIQALLNDQPLPGDHEFVLVRTDGSRFYGEIDGGVWHDAAGRPQGVVTVHRDITARKRAEEELRQSQAFNQALIDHSPLGISVRSRTGQLLFTNMAWRKIWAIPDADLQDDTTRKRDTLQFNARDNYLKPYQADLRRVYEQGGELYLPELKTTGLRPGAAEWISQHFYAIKDEHGQVDRVVILTEDITARKRAEEELRARESLLRSVVDNIPLEFWARDREGRCFMENAELVKHWGSLLGTRIEDTAASPQDLAIWRLNNARAFAGEVINEEVQFSSHGELRYFQNIVAPIRSGDEIPGILGLNVDITDRRLRERELQAIAAIATALRAANTRDEMIPVIVQQIYSLLKVDGAALIVPDAATGEAIIVYSQGIGTDSSGLRIPPGAGIVGHVIATGRPYLTQAAEHDPYVFRPDLASELHALLCAPLIAHAQIIGVLWVGKRTRHCRRRGAAADGDQRYRGQCPVSRGSAGNAGAARIRSDAGTGASQRAAHRTRSVEEQIRVRCVARTAYADHVVDAECGVAGTRQAGEARTLSQRHPAADHAASATY